MKIEHKYRGWKITDENGNITYVGEYGVEGACEGVIYKDYDAFENGGEDEVVYISEYGFENEEENGTILFEFEDKEKVGNGLVGNTYQSKTGYTRKNLIDLCDGDAEKASALFDECEWTFPETVLDQWEEF